MRSIGDKLIHAQDLIDTGNPNIRRTIGGLTLREYYIGQMICAPEALAAALCIKYTDELIKLLDEEDKS